MKNKKNTIGTIGIMSGTLEVPVPFLISYAQMIQFNNEYLCNPGDIIHLAYTHASYHSLARNSLVKQRRGDWTLMLDTDHSFEPHICARMVHIMYKYDVEVLVGMYMYKSTPHTPVLYTWNENKDGFSGIAAWDETATIFEIASSGGGCLLVKNSVYDRLEAEYTDTGPFSEIPPYSEDHSFFMRLSKIGVQPYCAPSIQYNHLITKEVTLDDYYHDKDNYDILTSDNRINVGGYA